jgi:hypothetical protein
VPSERLDGGAAAVRAIEVMRWHPRLLQRLRRAEARTQVHQYVVLKYVGTSYAILILIHAQTIAPRRMALSVPTVFASTGSVIATTDTEAAIVKSWVRTIFITAPFHPSLAGSFHFNERLNL